MRVGYGVEIRAAGIREKLLEDMTPMNSYQWHRSRNPEKMLQAMKPNVNLAEWLRSTVAEAFVPLSHAQVPSSEVRLVWKWLGEWWRLKRPPMPVDHKPSRSMAEKGWWRGIASTVTAPHVLEILQGSDRDDRHLAASLLRDVIPDPFARTRIALCGHPAIEDDTSICTKCTDILQWNDYTVPRTVQKILERYRMESGLWVMVEPRYDILPILADALDEAGCRDQALMNHLRLGPKHRHCQYCWALMKLGPLCIPQQEDANYPINTLRRETERTFEGIQPSSPFTI